MAIIDRLRAELDRAKHVVQDGVDEGRLRLEMHRERKLANKSAQALGYLWHHAIVAGVAVDETAGRRLSTTVAEHETRASEINDRIAALARNREGVSGLPATRATPETGP